MPFLESAFRSALRCFASMITPFPMILLVLMLCCIPTGKMRVSSPFGRVSIHDSGRLSLTGLREYPTVEAAAVIVVHAETIEELLLSFTAPLEAEDQTETRGEPVVAGRDLRKRLCKLVHLI
jgi:hypothetical protein